MALINLKEGGTIFGDVEDYNRKDNFLVITDEKDGKKYKTIIHWSNIIRVVE